METNDRIYFGSTPKFVLEIVGDGFDMARDDFDLVLKGSAGSLRIAKKDMFVGSDGMFYFSFDTRKIGTGKVKAVVTARVPDRDVPGGARTEVYVIEWFANVFPV